MFDKTNISSQMKTLLIFIFIIFQSFYGSSIPPRKILVVYPAGHEVKNPEIEFTSLEKAVDASKLKSGNYTIALANGPHFLKKTILLDSLNCNLEITAQKGAKPILYGGKQIYNWKEEGKYLVADAPESDFRILEINGRFAKRSRIPESGTFDHVSVFKNKWLSTSEGGFDVKPTKDQLLTMKYKPEDLGNISDIDNTEITLYHMWDESLMRVANNDIKNNKITFTKEPTYPAGAFGITKYVIWNSKVGMTKPGQWYFDRKTGKLYYWPLSGETKANLVAIIPIMDELFRIENTKNISINKIEIRSNNSPLMIGGFGAKWFSGAINVENSKNLKFDHLKFCNLTTHAIKAIKCNDVIISNCLIHNIGAAGIRLIGSGASITNNLIHDVGLIYPSTIALYLNVTDPNAIEEWNMGKDEGNNVIDHNEIFNAPYTAISSGGHDTKITNNKVTKVMQTLADGGGLYITFCKNLILKGNYVGDISKQYGSGTSAIYLDEMTDNALIEGNLVVNVNRPLHNHLTEGNVIRNNVFINTEGGGLLTFPRCKNFTFEKNVFLSREPIEIHGINVLKNRSDNVFFNSSQLVTVSDIDKYTVTNPQEVKKGFPGIIVEDPKIISYENGKVIYKKKSIIESLNIIPVNVSKAGSTLKGF